MSGQPRIGIAVGRESHDGRRFDATPHEYVAAVLSAGGIPLLLPPAPGELARRTLEALDGLLLTGGGDISPTCYGASIEEETADVDEERDASELALVAEACRRALPILGICRGAQLLNVAFGGTLRQHLPAGDGVADRQRDRRYQTVHRVDLERDSVLSRLVESETLEVNSIHHQGIDVLGASLAAVGIADDGVVEVLEGRECRVLAVQWHPECLPEALSSRELFGWLVAEAALPATSEAAS